MASSRRKDFLAVGEGDAHTLADRVQVFPGERENVACRALCRARVAEELQRRRGTRILALSIIDRQQER